MSTHAVTLATDRALLPEAVAAVRAAGAKLRERFTPDARPGGHEELIAALLANDQASLGELRAPLHAARPNAGWVVNELEGGALPDGEWWVTDPAEGNINHVHGMPEWSVTATLVRDNQPVVTAVHLPLTDDTYTAVRGGGAFHNGVRLRASAKERLADGYVGTGQAKPGEDARTFRRIGRSLTAMLESALVTRVSVPATLQLVQVAAGRMDAFWQYSDVRSGLLAGALLVAESGGTVTDTHGDPWTVASQDFLAAAPALHTAVVRVLSSVN
ncbi:inositol monophosphatase family protein [Streptomyces silvisoli]|uniref:Inositol monophosphatase family protein n=1 Tax=Streptomyces silvisoli TaxID=3034235 RepID=A0ABT5ZNL6_9ACTN|nr:inositol monophosphatase family protein [Streptomyces silvisoli]MDF3291425.1 inositol monophosphatase family protein [Streptomyces silvisoli]